MTGLTSTELLAIAAGSLMTGGFWLAFVSQLSRWSRRRR